MPATRPADRPDDCKLCGAAVKRGVEVCWACRSDIQTDADYERACREIDAVDSQNEEW